MEAALGVLKGKQLGEQRVIADEDRAFEVGKRGRAEQADALSLAAKTLENEEALNTARARRQRKAYIKQQLIAEGRPEEEAEFWSEKEVTSADLAAQKTKAENERIKHAADVELTKARTEQARRAPVDPFARMAETFRQQQEKTAAERWQALYVDFLKPKRNQMGDIIAGTGMSPAEAAQKADEAMGGRPALAPKVKAGTPEPPPMGTDYNPAKE
jgi:hypothetical protein